MSLGETGKSSNCLIVVNPASINCWTHTVLFVCGVVNTTRSDAYFVVFVFDLLADSPAEAEKYGGKEFILILVANTDAISYN